jgi:hypothetical protein
MLITCVFKYLFNIRDWILFYGIFIFLSLTSYVALVLMSFILFRV